MTLDRRQFLVRTGLALGAGTLAGSLGDDEREAVASLPPLDSWKEVRAQFALAPEYAHFGGFLLASHPASVRAAIRTYRRALDANPVHYLHEQGPAREAAVLRAAATYLRADAADIALTDSTTMGLGLLYAGLRVRAGQELLTTRHDFFATHEALRRKAERVGATVRTIALYESPDAASEEEMLERIVAAVTPATRVVALTWVHSSTGVRLPVKRIAEALAEQNAGRDEDERALLCVDGVHGLGVEDVALPELGCDFFVAGCHKWLFGPRGTGLVWGKPEAWPAATATIPSFTDDGTPGGEMTPGGFHSFEHRWALAQAFAFHLRIGRRRVARRIHGLNRELKDGLAAMGHVRLHTPRPARLSAGLVCFSVDGLTPSGVVRALRRRGIIATVTPYQPSYARVGPGLLNTRAEIEKLLRAIRSLA